MDARGWIDSLLGDCQWVRSPEQALGLLPDLVTTGPQPVEVRLQGDRAPFRGLPVACYGRVWRAVARVGLPLLEEAIRHGGPWSQEDVDFEADDLVAEVARLLLEADPLGPGARSLVLLEVARASASILSGDLSDLERVSPGAARGLERRVEELAGLEPAAAGRVLQGMVAALATRLGAAHALAARIDPLLRPTRMLQALLANRLALAFSPGTIDLERDVERVVACLGIEADAVVVASILRAVRVGLRGALEGGGGPIGAAVRDLLAPSRDEEAASLDPEVAALVLHGLPDLASARQLRGAGLSREQARHLLDREGAVSALALHRQVCRELLRWDLLGACMRRCLPVWVRKGAWTSPLGDLEPSLAWSALAPGEGLRPREVHVVAVQLGEAWVQAAQLGANDGESAVLAGLWTRWRALEARAAQAGGLSAFLGGVGIACFEGEEPAAAFADAAEAAFRAPVRVDLAPLGGRLQLPADLVPVVWRARRRLVLAWAGGRPLLAGAGLGGTGGAEHEEDLGTDEEFEWLDGGQAAPVSDPFREEDAAGGTEPPPVAASDPFADGAPARDAMEEGPPLPAADPFGDPPAGEDPFASSAAVQEPAASDPSSAPPAGEDPFGGPAQEAPPVTAADPETGDVAEQESGEAVLQDREEPGAPPAVDLGFMDAAPEPSTGPSAPSTGAVLEILDEEEDEEEPCPATSSSGDTAQRFLDPAPPLLDEDSQQGAFRFPSMEADSLDSLTYGRAQAEAAGPSLQRSAIPGFEIDQIRPLFEGYVTYRESADRIVFGRPYGSTVVDRHVYEWDGDLLGSYRAFLRDKVREGFVPRTDLTGRLPPGVTPRPLDFDRLGQAMEELG